MAKALSEEGRTVSVFPHQQRVLPEIAWEDLTAEHGGSLPFPGRPVSGVRPLRGRRSKHLQEKGGEKVVISTGSRQ